MQNKYVGDEADFVKLGIIHHLAQGLVLGINWYFTPNGLMKNDEGHGGNIGYLLKLTEDWVKYKKSLPKIYELLRTTLFKDTFEDIELNITFLGEKNLLNADNEILKKEFIVFLEKEFLSANSFEKLSKIFRKKIPHKTFVPSLRTLENLVSNIKIHNPKIVHYSTPLGFPESKNEWNIHGDNIQRREKWFKVSKDVLITSDIIYLDPNTGLNPTTEETDYKKIRKKDAVKYVMYDEVKEYLKEGKSLVIYSNYQRIPKEKYKNQLNKLREQLTSEKLVIIEAGKKSKRNFIFIIKSEHQEKITNSLKELLEIEYLYSLSKFDPSEISFNKSNTYDDYMIF